MHVTDSLHFDTRGFQEVDRGETWVAWHNETGVTLELEFLPGPPDPGPVHDHEQLRNELREECNRVGAGAVDITFRRVGDLPCLRTIVKRVMDEKTGWGRSYHGVLQVLFEDCLFVVRARAEEFGTTGMREAMMWNRFSHEGTVTLGPDPEVGAEERRFVNSAATAIGWLSDPNDPTPRHLARNRSEDEAYDRQFPQHPLSQVRATLHEVENTMTVDEGFLREHRLWRGGDPKNS